MDHEGYAARFAMTSVVYEDGKLPGYEGQLISGVMEEVYASHEPRSLLGIAVSSGGSRSDRRITSMTFPDGRGLERDKRYVIAVNSFDARSGGHHFMKLRALLERPEAKCVLHPVQTRDALIDYFRRHKVVQRIAAIPPLGIAA